MSEFKITNNISNVKYLIELLESKPVINETSYIFDKKFKSIVTFNLPLFDRSEFDGMKILDYINATECIKIDGLREQLLYGFKQVLLMDCHNFDDKMFKGKYSIDIPKEIKSNDLQRIIDEQVRKANLRYFRDTMGEDVVGWDPIAVNEYTKLMKYSNDANTDLFGVLQAYMDAEDESQEDNVKDIDSDDLVVMANVTDTNNISLLTTTKIKQIKQTKQQEQERFDAHTKDILDCIPFTYGNIIFSGGLLFDNITKHKLFDVDKLADIDLFIFGDDDQKLKTIQKIVDNLKNEYDIVMGVNRSVIDIFIIGVPRIVQIICTNYRTAHEVIDNFDLCHLMSYFDGNNMIITPKAKECILNNYAKLNEKYEKRLKYSRIVKTISRGLNVDKLLQNVHLFLQHDYDHYEKYIEQVKYYVDTHNLTHSFYQRQIFELFQLNEYDSKNIVLNGNFDNYTQSTMSDNDIHEDHIKDLNIIDSGSNINRTLKMFKLSKYNNLLIKGRVISTCANDRYRVGPEDHSMRILFEVTDSKFISYFIKLTHEIKKRMLDSKKIKPSSIFNIPIKPSKVLTSYKYHELANKLEHDEIIGYNSSNFDKYLETLDGIVLTIIFKNDPKYVINQEILLGVRLNIYTREYNMYGFNIHDVHSVIISK
jgi:hypothetical protein